MRHPYLLTPIAAALVFAGSSACATKGFVTETVADRVGTVEGRVDTVEQSVDENAKQTRMNTARLGEVDQTANTALETASSAETAAGTAQDTASKALTRTARLEAANGLLLEVVLAQGYDQFGFAKSTLSDEATRQLDTMVRKLSDYPTGVYLEIAGYTDSTGPASFNERLGLERAEAVKRYLYATHHVPLHKMNVISYGEEQPAAANDTREGRAKNRRVVVRVLAAEGEPPANASGPATGADTVALN